MLKRQHKGGLFAPFWNMAAIFRIPKALFFFNKKSKKFGIVLLGLLLAITVLNLGVWLEYWKKLKWESLKKRRRDRRLILLYKGLKGAASIPTDDLMPPIKPSRNHHSLTFDPHYKN